MSLKTSYCQMEGSMRDKKRKSLLKTLDDRKSICLGKKRGHYLLQDPEDLVSCTHNSITIMWLNRFDYQRATFWFCFANSSCSDRFWQEEAADNESEKESSFPSPLLDFETIGERSSFFHQRLDKNTNLVACVRCFWANIQTHFLIFVIDKFLFRKTSHLLGNWCMLYLLYNNMHTLHQ